MPSVEQRTVLQIRRSVGFLLGAVTTSRPTTAGGTSSHTDVNILGSTTLDAFRGRWIHCIGESSGSVRRISGNTTAGVFSYMGAIATALATGSEYELWDEDMPPPRLDDFITRSVLDVTHKGAVSTTDYSLHTSPRFFTYPMSTSFAGVAKVEYRQSFERQVISEADSAWNDQLLGTSTRVADTADYREGSGSNKVNIGAAATTGILSAHSFTALNLTGYTHIEGWLKSDVATTTSDLQLRLHTSTSLGSPLENIVLPALTSGLWTYFRLPFASAAALTSVSAIGYNLRTDLGAQTFWYDRVQATNQHTEKWETIPARQWWLDKSAGNLCFDSDAVPSSGALLKVTAYRRPTLPTGNASVIEENPEYVTYRVAAMAMRARADRRGDRRQADLQQADIYDAIAERKRLTVSMPAGVRWFDNR